MFTSLQSSSFLSLLMHCCIACGVKATCRCVEALVELCIAVYHKRKTKEGPTHKELLYSVEVKETGLSTCSQFFIHVFIIQVYVAEQSQQPK